MRELMVALSDLEKQLEDAHGVSLNEAMALCALGEQRATATVIAERTGLRPSHCSKVIGALEKRALLLRELGKSDKRQMIFSLSDAGKSCLAGIRAYAFDVPPTLQGFFAE